MWYIEQVAKQLGECKAPADVEVSLNFQISNHYTQNGSMKCTNTCEGAVI